MAINFRKMPTGGKRKKGDRVMRKTLPINLQFFAEGRKDDGAVRSDAEDSSVVQNEVRYFKGSIRMQLWCDDIWKVEASVRKNCWNC